jgi:DNA-binding response OmpR family regulator
MARIIVVEDNLAQQEEILSFLKHVGHEVVGIDNGSTLDERMQQFAPDIILLDYNLPGEIGPVLAARLRGKLGMALGIVMVTARSLSVDRIECRRAGVDDYLVKPVDFNEMLAVIDNLLLRLESSTLTEQVWKLVPAQAELLPPGGAPVTLAGSEVMLLTALAEGASRRASREELIHALGKHPDYYDPRALEASISRLRRKLPALEDGRNPLQALRGIGYQFVRPLKIIA